MPSSSFSLTELYTAKDDKAYFRNIEIDTDIILPLGNYSKSINVKEMILRNSIVSKPYEWHTAPQKQFIVYLSGKVEIETSGGEVREFTQGDIILVSDTWGAGHKTTVLIEGSAIILPILSD